MKLDAILTEVRMQAVKSQKLKQQQKNVEQTKQNALPKKSRNQSKSSINKSNELPQKKTSKSVKASTYEIN